MAERAKHNDPQDKKGFGKGKTEAPRKTVKQPKETAKTREAKRSKGGSRERETS